MGFFKDLIQRLRGKDNESRVRRLDQRVDELKSQARSLEDKAKNISTKPVESWYKLSDRKNYTNVVRISFEPRKFKEVVTMKRLQEMREEEERKRIQRLKQNVNRTFNRIDALLENEKIDEASSLHAGIASAVKELDDSNLNTVYRSYKSKFSDIRDRIRKREIQRRIEEENRRKEILRRQEEEKERQRQAEIRQKEREEAERNRRQREAREYEERLKRQAEEESRKKEQLKSLVTRKKTDWQDFITYLQLNRVVYFYHFTDVENLRSIKRLGGLYSWKYCVENDIIIPSPGGDSTSRNLDKRHGLEDYVRLSFCDDHPMAYKKHKRDGSQLVLLKIKIEVAAFEHTLFSDINATDNNHTNGGTIRHLKMVDIRATQRHFVRNTDPDFKLHQAECMVKTFVPIDYIVNIDYPDYIYFS